MTDAPSKLSSDAVRTLFSTAMSRMYRTEVPQYGALLDLVADVNRQARLDDPQLGKRLEDNGEVERLDLERHGAIRLGTAQELFTLRRLFAVMGMHPVGYYDLSVAGVPVHSTAFRPIDDDALRSNPLRVFTSLLRLDLIDDAALRQEAANILSRRRIFTEECLRLIDLAEENDGLVEEEAEAFVAAALETFRWHGEATVSASTYERLRKAHPLVADVVCFRGPHINHLTPRTLDIDAVQAGMSLRGMTPKAVIEGPPTRRVPILLRQTSFKAIEEPVAFLPEDGDPTPGAHTARFGEVEQRGVALTRKGRALYDELLAAVRATTRPSGDGANAPDYASALSEAFAAFPDDETQLRKRGLAYFRFTATERGGSTQTTDFEQLIAEGFVAAEPITYEDFLPVSAAGIFQSNLGDSGAHDFVARANQKAFETALGAPVTDEIRLYERAETRSQHATLSLLRQRGSVAAA